MRKLIILFMIAALMGCLSVSAQNPYRCDTIALGETKVITVPAPDGEIDEGTVYFQQEFTFTAEESGTYRMIMSYEDDPKNPYDVFLDVPGNGACGAGTAADSQQSKGINLRKLYTEERSGSRCPTTAG